jgi:hypothetical protein
MLYLGSEIMLFFSEGRVMQEKYLFGIEITNMQGLWIPLLAVGDVVMLAVFALFFADRIRNSETRKKWGILFIVWIFCRDVIPYIILFGLGNSFNTISEGDPLIYSRRNMIEVGTLIALSIMVGIAIILLVKTDNKSRKRGLYMIGTMLILMTAWSFGEWFSGQRWIEVGPEEGPWTLAPPLLQFAMFAYDIVIEMALFTLCFLAFPYFLKLIKSEKQD